MHHERNTNYYAILELSVDATEVDIKRAWHEQMQVWHPDRFVHSPRYTKKRKLARNSSIRPIKPSAIRLHAPAMIVEGNIPPPRRLPHRALVQRLARNRPHVRARSYAGRKPC